MKAAFAFTAVDPAGNAVPALTRLRQRAVKDAIREFLRGRPDKCAAHDWADASRLGWRVVPVTMTMRGGAL